MTTAPSWLTGLDAALGTPDFPAGVPTFDAVHRWLADTVIPLTLDSCAALGEFADPLVAVQALHRRAIGGESVSEFAWRAALEPAFQIVFRLGYPYEEAFEAAAAGASAYALANGYTEEQARTYGDDYALINTAANVRVSSAAHAAVAARAWARALASEDHRLLAAAYPGAYLQAHAQLIKQAQKFE